jgi:hypothetical protein
MTDEIPVELREALRPFIFAAAVGWSVAEAVREAKPNQHSKYPLVAFGSYAGQYAAESRVSWRDWQDLLDAADKCGLLASEAPTDA